MKKFASTGVLVLLSLGTGRASAQSEAFSYVGAPLVRQLVGQLVGAPGRDCGLIDYDTGSPELQGVGEMNQGLQETALMLRPFDAQTCQAQPEARQIIIAKDRMPLLVNSNNGLNTCDLILTDNVAGYQSDVPGWAEALQLVYGGVDGRGTRSACAAPQRANLIKNWSRLWKNNCEDSKCEALRFAFRRGDNSSMSKVLKSLLGVKAFCNGAQNEDLDPIRSDCSNADDVDWCPDGTLGVVQAVELSLDLPVYPRMGCAEGNYEFGFNSSGDACPDGTELFAGFLCSYPRNCLNRFGCINSAVNGSPLNPFMDGRVYNELQLDEELAPLEIPSEASPSFVYFNGRCTAGNDGRRTDAQLGCLVHQVACSMAVTSARNIAVPITEVSAGPACGQERLAPSRAAVVNDAPINLQGPGYPLSRPVYFSTLNLPVEGNEFDCDAIENAEERKFCGCVFNKNLLDGETRFSLNDTVADYKVLECGDVE